MTERSELPQEGMLFRALIAVAADGIVVIDEQGVVTIYNHACETMFGFASDEVVGRKLTMLMPEPFRSDHEAYIGRYLATGTRHIIGIGREVSGQRKDGTTFPMYISVGEGVAGSTRVFIGIMHDISARRARENRIEELQHELRHVTRLSAMGQLSAAIAHELNQPLAAALNYTNSARHLLSDFLDETAAHARAAVEKSAVQIGRAGDVLRRLREFIEKREQSRAPIDVNQTVADAIALGMIGTMGTTIFVETRLEAALPHVLADRVQIQQVIINLMLNAADAMEHTAEPRLLIETGRQPDGAIRVAVVDNGIGLSDEAGGRLFQPFVTTKPNGIGMGLSICRSIVEAHGGRLWAEPGRQTGAAFQFTLPVADDAEPARP